MIVKIIPTNIDYALELFVKPFDLVLIDTGQRVRFIFDGYPAIIFSGWPKASYGTFVGKVIAIETNLSANGLFRVLVVEDENERKWPENLKLGTGAVGFALLKNVPIWYELWRNINGFPPVYYKTEASQKPAVKSNDELQKAYIIGRLASFYVCCFTAMALDRIPAFCRWIMFLRLYENITRWHCRLILKMIAPRLFSKWQGVHLIRWRLLKMNKKPLPAPIIIFIHRQV